MIDNNFYMVFSFGFGLVSPWFYIPNFLFVICLKYFCFGVGNGGFGTSGFGIPLHYSMALNLTSLCPLPNALKLASICPYVFCIGMINIRPFLLPGTKGHCPQEVRSVSQEIS